ncbi:helix-hairpin-helix domain-containing protein [Kitasatospora sp. NPDC092948]|uniref:helix-hairpin-helix domain-containing protein n=1 Tax=Kitasatospora sp. NPDC092948 TaxID=3364088 RepID=UPI003820C184
MRTITTPQTRRRQTVATARARIGLLFPPTRPADLGPPLGPGAELLSGAPEQVGAAEVRSGEPSVPADRTEIGTASEPERAVERATTVPDPPYALSSPRVLAMYGVAARSAATTGPSFTDSAFGRPVVRQGTTPERDPPSPVADIDSSTPAVPEPPPDDRADLQSDPDPPELDIPSATEPTAVSHHTDRPHLPLRFRIPTAFALDRRAVLGLAVLLALAVGYAAQHFWWGRPHPVTVPAISISESTTESTTEPATEGAPVRHSSSASLVVDIAGKVQHPGLRTLPAGSRVADALTAAGGPIPGTDTSPLNLARPLSDGEQILVGTEIAPGGAPAASAGPVSLNRSSAEQLDSLPGVGPALAQRILQYRLAHGPFQSLDQLRHVSGIGPRKYEDLKPLLTL